MPNPIARAGLPVTCALAVACGAVSNPLRAAEDDAAVDASPVVVTATRTARTANEALASVTVLDRAAIETSGASSLTEILTQQEGISAATRGPFGKTTSLFLRGTNSDHVLLMVDGVKVGSATTGTPAFQHLPLHQIERIEIVRGPGSSLHGSEAIGGVIHVFTRDGAGEELRAETSAMAGGAGTSEVTAAFSGGDADSRFSISASAFNTEGIDVRTDGFPDEDGYRNDSFSLRFAEDLTQATTWSVSALRADGLTEFDRCGPSSNLSGACEDRFLQQAVSTRLDTQVTGRWSMQLSLGSSEDERTLVTDGDFDSAFDTRRDEFRWQNDFSPSAGQLITLGLDYRRDEVSGTTDYDRAERDNTALFGQWQWSGERADASVSARRDDNEAFGEETTGSIAAGYRFAETTRVYGSVGTGFKAPTFNDLYFPDTSSFRGNPDLDPERSRTVELGLKGGGSNRWNISAYHTRIEDVIVLDGGSATVDNLDEAAITGLEVSGATTHGGWRLQGGVTLLGAWLETDGANDGNRLPRRPDRKVTFDFRRDLGPVTIGGNVRHEADRFDDVANRTRLEGFTLVGLRVGIELYPELHLEASVDNLADVEHQTVDNFASLGRTGYVRLRYQPQDG